uniref:Uncharacterized protein n=1 Tax=Geospiza parvula TaxID=87175 RepID=A0A8C3M7D5_GEOPR
MMSSAVSVHLTSLANTHLTSASRVFQMLKGQGSFFFCFLKVFEIHLPATPPGKPENLPQCYSVTWLPTQHHSKTSSPPRNTHARKSKQRAHRTETKAQRATHRQFQG